MRYHTSWISKNISNLFINKNRKLHQGFAMVILRSTQTAGKVKVKVSSKELKGVEKELLTK